MTLDYNQHTLKGNYYKTDTWSWSLLLLNHYFYFTLTLKANEIKAVCADPKSVYSRVS